MGRSIFALILLAASAAIAGPFGPWAAELERAEARGAEAVVAQVQAAPALARVWAYGHLPDAVTGPVDDQIRWRARVTAVAEALPDADLSARLRDAGLAAALAALPPLPSQSERVMLQAVEQDLAAFLFYSAIFRASLGQPGESERAEGLLADARHLAQGRAAIVGRLDWFGDLAAWYGGEVPVRGRGEVDDALTRLLNARLAGDDRTVQAQGEIALRAADRHGLTVLAALVSNLGAFVSGWRGRPREEASLRIQVLQAIRPLGHPHLTAALLASLVAPHLADGRHEAALTFLEELDALGGAAPTGGVLGSRVHREALDAAAAAFRARVEAERARGDVAAASRAADAALRAEELARRADPTRPEALLVAAHALQARLALDRGLADEVHARLATAPPSLALGRLDAEALMLRGHLAEARRVLDATAAAPTPAEAAGLDADRGRLALAEGRAAPAFAFANRGLRLLLGQPAAAAPRAELHTLAATALHAAGLLDAARARLDFAARAGGADFELARLRALAHLAAGDDAAALRVLAPLSSRFAPGGPPDDARAARVGEGCILAGSPRAAEALDALAAGDGVQGPLALQARLCRVAALLQLDRPAEAARALAEARAGTSWAADPVIAWRANALASRLAAREGQAVEAASLARMAALEHAALGYERPAGGFTLGAGTWIPPRDADALWATLPGLLVAAAEQDRGAAGAHQRAAVVAALVDQRLRLTGRSLVPGQATPVVADGARLAHLRASLARPGIGIADAQRLRRLATAGPWVPGSLVPDPAWRPRPGPEDAIVLYRFEAQAGHLWVLRPGADPRHFPLPGADAAAALLAAPELPMALVPWATDPETSAALAELTVWLIPDGPLVAARLEDRPAAVGGALRGRFRLRRALPAPALPGDGPTPPPGIGVVGPQDAEATAILAAAGGRGTVGADLAERLAIHGRLVVTAPLDAATGEVGGAPVALPAAAEVSAGASVVVFARVVGGADATGFLRLADRLRRRGVRAVILAAGEVPAPEVARLAGRLAAGDDPHAAAEPGPWLVYTAATAP